ncbi:helix-turn-helix transcriptional regulator [Longispora urticae]
MATYAFTLVLNRVPSDEELDELYEAGCEDASFGTEGGGTIGIAEFDRNAETLADAIASAVRDVEKVSGLKAVRVADDDLLTLADIATRVGRSRESIRRYALGERGGGEFPVPVNPGREGTTFYRWSEVAPWLRERMGMEVDISYAALTMANLVLQVRMHQAHVEHSSALTDLLDA